MILLFRDVLRLGTQCVRCLAAAQVDAVCGGSITRRMPVACLADAPAGTVAPSEVRRG